MAGSYPNTVERMAGSIIFDPHSSSLVSADNDNDKLYG